MKINEVIIRGDIDLDRLSTLPLGDDKVSIMSEQSIPVQLGGGFDVISKAKGGERIIAGYASIIEVDKEDHIIPKSALEYGIQTLLNDSEYSNLMLIHQNVQIGKIIPTYKNLKTHVDDKGLFICAKIRSDLEIANEVWGMILDGKLNGFSIAGEIVEATIECDDTKCVKKIEKLNIFEVSVCDYPVNSKSGFVVVSKSSDTADVGEGDVINKKVEQMAKKKVKEEPECVECSEEETPTETKAEEETIEASEPTMDINQTIEELSRQVAALTGIVEQMNAKSEEVVEEAKKQDEEEEEEMEEEEEEEEMTKAEEKPEETPTEKKAETSVNISKEDFDELKKSIEEALKEIKKSKEVSELEVAIKAKDDEIVSLSTKIETLEKAEVEPQTTNTLEVVEDTPVKVSDVSFVKDTLGKGVFYHNPDY